MVKAILAKAGIVAFSRVCRVVQDALVVKGSQAAPNKELLIQHLLENSVVVVA